MNSLNRKKTATATKRTSAASSSKSAASRQRMVAAAGAAFREHGLGGIGVDGLAAAADLTSGAFYFHFHSKLEAFTESMVENLDALKKGVEKLQAENPDAWVREFAAFYLGYKRTCGMRDGCAVPLLSSEVERAGQEVRTAYENKLVEVFEALAKGLPASPDFTSADKAQVLMALLAGGVMLARTVPDPKLSEHIAESVQKAVACLV